VTYWGISFLVSAQAAKKKPQAYDMLAAITKLTTVRA
jgi:hypothetical protein